MKLQASTRQHSARGRDASCGSLVFIIVLGYGLKIHSVGPGLILVYDITLQGIKINNNFINIHRNGIVADSVSICSSQ